MKTEIFKSIPGYKGLYQISNFGNIKSLGKFKGKKEKIIKSFLKTTGYYGLTLAKNKKQKSHHIHQLMAVTFLKHKPDGNTLVVDHIDGNKLNNRLDNLQIITNRENSSKDKKNGSSQYVGVSWDKRQRKWRANIFIDQKSRYLGIFRHEIEAAEAYQKALSELNS